LEERQVLQNLPLKQVELALQCLAQEQLDFLPPELEKLSPVEWFLLEQLLNSLMLEKQYSRVH
jgi:hypothetical protein